MIRMLVAAALAIVVALPARSDFEDGKAAYLKGDHATALREWRPLAEQGDADVMFLVKK